MSRRTYRELGRQGPVLAVVGLLALLLVGCARADSIEVSASAPPSVPPAVPAPAPAEPDATFQGAVIVVDLDTNEVGVAVQIEWQPVLRAVREDRRVAVSADTRWAPAGTGLAMLHAGDEVQVDAVRGPDGTWQAQQVQLFDID